MDNDADTIITNTPIITGAVYERTRGSEVEQAVCLARITENGRVFGLFRRFGMAFERFQENTEEMLVWTLTWAPTPTEVEVETSTGEVENGSKISDRTGKPVRKYTKRK
jgi:hypothetical protein|tara:strand:+ start:536 stop:862 length:327 start_codon:yes stop_codon:yes gene_type:complete